MFQKSFARETALVLKERRPKNSTFVDFLLLQSLINYFSNFRERWKYSLQYIFLALRRDDESDKSRFYEEFSLESR